MKDAKSYAIQRSTNNIRPLGKQRGFALLEVTLAMALLAGISIKAMMDEYEQLRNTQIQAQALQVKNLQNAQNEYIAKYFKNLVYNTAISGVSNIYQPTVEELATLAVGLPTNAKSTAIIGGSYKMKLTVSPAGCTPGNCQIDGLVWIDTPYKTNSTVDGARLGAAVRAIGPDGAYSTTATPGTLSGYAGQWSQTNPVGSVAGILAARTGYTSSSLSYYVRLDGTNPMTGPLNMNSNAISNVTTLTSTGDITSGGKMTAAGALSGSSLTTSGNAAVTGALTAGSVASNTTINATGTITGSRVQSNGATSGGASQSYYDLAGNRIAANGSIYSYGKICSQNNYGDCSGAGGTVIDGSNVQAYGYVQANGGLYSYARSYSVTNDWALTTYDGAWGNNGMPQSATGSLYVNDVYFRSIGKWASQMGSGGAVALGSNGYKVLDNSGLAIQWGYTTNHGENQYQALNYCFPNATVYVSALTAGRPYKGADGHNNQGSWDRCGFTYDTETGAGGSVWMAIGY